MARLRSVFDMSDSNCTTDTNGCIDCAAVPASTGTPGRTLVSSSLGWNASADSGNPDGSRYVLAGDIIVRNTMPIKVAGIVVGLRSVQDANFDPTRITHGFYFFTVGGLDLHTVVEFGVQLITPVAHTNADVFAICRLGGIVTYRVNGKLVLTSSAPSYAPVFVNACLFGSGDSLA